MKKSLSLLLVAALLLTVCLSFCGCDEGLQTESKVPTVEDTYAQLVECAKNGEYQEAWRLCQRNRAVLDYKDGQAYSDYCEAMRAYEAGGIGFAYNTLKPIPEILDAQKTIDEIEATIGQFNGYYVADNGMGSYLHMVIRDGMIASEVIGYTNEEQTFDYNAESVYWYSMIQFTDSTGGKHFAIGRYNTIGAKIDTIDYVLFFAEESPELTVVKHESGKHNTMNGAYTKIAEVEPA